MHLLSRFALMSLAVLGVSAFSSNISLYAAGQSSGMAANQGASFGVQYTSPDGAFTARFPKIPHRESVSVPLSSGNGSITQDVYLSLNKEGITYIITAIQYPQQYDTSVPQKLFETLMNGMAKAGPNYQLLNSQPGEFQGMPCLDFNISNEDLVIRSKAFLTGHTIYVITLIATKKDDVDSLFKQFIDSFSLSKQAQAAKA